MMRLRLSYVAFGLVAGFGVRYGMWSLWQGFGMLALDYVLILLLGTLSAINR